MEKRLFTDYVLLQLLFFILMGTFCGYGSYLLIQFGFSTSVTGIIMSVGFIASALIQPIFASIVDNSKESALFNVCAFISMSVLILSVLAYTQIMANIMLALMYICLNALYSCFEPLLNSIPIILANNGYRINYGVGRAVGSLGYASATAMLGLLTAKLPYKVILLVAITTCIILTVVCLAASKNFSSIKTQVNTPRQDTISSSQFLSRHRSFLLLMLLTIGIYYSFTMVDNMMYLVVENVGGTSKQQGLIMSFKAILEIPIIFFYDRIEKRFSAKTLLKVAAISFVIKSLLYYISADITLIWIAQLTQLTSLALEIPAMVSYINSIMDKKELVRGQALFVMSITIASVLSGFSSGIIIDNYSVKTMLLICLIVSTVSAIAYPFVIDKLD